MHSLVFGAWEIKFFICYNASQKKKKQDSLGRKKGKWILVGIGHSVFVSIVGNQDSQRAEGPRAESASKTS